MTAHAHWPPPAQIRHHSPPDNEPTPHQAIHLVTQLGGLIATQGEPGAQTIRYGLQRLDAITVVYCKLVELTRAGRKPL